MRDFFYKRGAARAAADAGVAKLASKPEMGDAMYETISSATGDEGRTRMRSNENPGDQVNTSMLEHDRHVLRDPHNDAHVFPVGTQQSHNLRLAAVMPITGKPKADEHDKGLDLGKLIQGYAVNSSAAPTQYEKLVESSPVPVQPHGDAPKHGGGGFVAKDYKDIKGPSIITDPDKPNANLLAHEIGHAQFQESPFGAAMQHPGARALRYAAPPAALAAGRFLPGGKAKALGVGAALGLTAPTLIGEGAASYKGYQHLKDLGSSDEELSQYLKDIALPQAGYFASPLLAAGAGLAGAKIPKMAAARKLHGRRKFRNLNISIENRKGSSRHWYDADADRHGSTVQKYPYGYIRMTEGIDGDHVDCYVGPHENAKNVYIVTTNKAPDFKKIDEQKCMLGFSSATTARKAFAQHYDNPGFFRSMKVMPYEEFERKVLATLHSKQKKVASNRYQSDDARLIDNSPGTTHNQVPGDHLGLPHSSLVGMRSIKGGHPEDPSDAIDRMFRFHDNPMSSRVLEGNSSALPESPGV